MCLVERRKNINNINNLKLDPHERAVTFEGKDYMSEFLKIQSSNLSEKVVITTKRIVEVIISS